MGLNKETCQILAELGFIACVHSHFDEAESLFKAVAAYETDKDSCVGLTGLGYIKISRGLFAKGIEEFNKAVEKDQTNKAAVAYRGLAHFMQSDEGAMQADLGPLCDDPSAGEPVNELAQSAIDYAAKEAMS